MLDSTVWTALLFGLISAVSLPLGALIGVFWKPPDRVVSVLLSFGGGALLAALTLDLVAPGVDRGHFEDLAIGAVLGGLLFKALNWVINREGGYLRKPSTALQYWRNHAQDRMQRLIADLGRTRQLGELSPDVLDDLVGLLQVREITAGTWLYRQGDPPSALWILDKGTVELIAPRSGRIIDTLSPHDVFGRMSFLAGLPRESEARAVSDCTVFVLPRDALLDRMPDSPELRSIVLHLVEAAEIERYLVTYQGLTAEEAAEWREDSVASIRERGTYSPALHDPGAIEGLGALLVDDHRSSFFAGLDPMVRDRIAEQFVPVTMAAGRTLCHPGHLANRMLVLLDGEVEVIDADDLHGEVEAVRPVSSIGALAFLTSGRHGKSAVSRSECHLAVLRREDFEDLLADDAGARTALADYLRSPEVSGYLTERQSIDPRRAAAWSDRASRSIEQGRIAPTVADLTRTVASHSAAAMAMFLGILLDGIPESFVIGANVLTSGGITLSLLTGLFLANFPEALSSSVGMREQGMSRVRILTMWTSLMVITGVGAGIGALVLVGANATTFALIEGIAAGAMLTMIAETMLPEAYHRGGGVVGLSTLGGFLAAILANHLG